METESCLVVMLQFVWLLILFFSLPLHCYLYTHARALTGTHMWDQILEKAVLFCYPWNLPFAPLTKLLLLIPSLPAVLASLAFQDHFSVHLPYVLWVDVPSARNVFSRLPPCSCPSFFKTLLKWYLFSDTCLDLSVLNYIFNPHFVFSATAPPSPNTFD